MEKESKYQIKIPKNQNTKSKWLVQWFSNFLNCNHCKKSFFNILSWYMQNFCVYNINVYKYVYIL